MARTNKIVRGANNIVISFDGIDVGLVQSVSSNDDYGHEGAYGIGDAKPVEHVPGAARHSISVSKIVMIKELTRKARIFAENSDDVLEGRVYDIVQYGKNESEVLRKYEGCSYVSGSTETTANRIVTSNAQFLALNVTGTGM